MRLPTPSKRSLLTTTLWILAPLFFALALLGTVRSYTAVPIWDMWSGYLSFFLQASEGKTAVWWELHNEHRIVLSKILFWIDLSWFHGTVWFLLAINFFLVLTAFFTFRALLKEKAAEHSNQPETKVFSLFIFICLFSWIQHENLAWGFQSQFFLAQLLPLLSFYFLHRNFAHGSTRDFVIACGCGILSVVSMANGVLALPLMALYAMLLRMGWRKIGVIIALAASCIILYLWDYPEFRSSSGTKQLTPIIQYFFVYLGGPFFYFIDKNIWAANIFGIVFFLLSSIKALQCFRNPRQNALDLCLLTFIAYIGGTALVTALGRSQYGIAQATASRYTTPALMAWMALLILYLPPLLKGLAKWQHRIVWPMMLLLLLMLPPQLKARKSQNQHFHEFDVAALAMELGIHDEGQIHRIIWAPRWAETVARKPIEDNLSIFGQAPIKNARLLLGQSNGPLPLNQCSGVIDEIRTIDEDPRFKKVRGWLLSPQQEQDFQSVRLVDAQGVIVGYALMGDNRPELRTQYGKFATHRGFQGYVMATHADSLLSITAPNTVCNVETISPPFKISNETIAPIASVNVYTTDIITNRGWAGKDYEGTPLPDLRILGSYVHGDSDTGTIKLRLQRGAKLLYKTGPHHKNQRIEVTGTTNHYQGTLPLAEQWSLLTFDNPTLPDKFEVIFTDAGNSWGEWSAIAIQDK